MASITVLRERVDGAVIMPDDPDYDEARRVYNFMIDKHPAAVVRCANVQDVQGTVEYARTTGRELAVRGGGHSVPGFGTADDAIVADLSMMNDVRVDHASQTAHVGGGATWGTFNDAGYDHGLGTTGGIISTTGVGGLTLGGGIGYLARSHGLSCDNLISAQVVLADGQVVTASETSRPDLFWALRGGGGNFGIVTDFEFRMHPVRDIYGGLLLFEPEDAQDVLRYFRDFIADAPREYGGFPAWQLAPPLPFVPEDRVGDPFIVVVSCWNGDHDEGARLPKRGQQLLQVGDDGQAVARGGAGIGQGHAGAVIGDRANRPGRQLLLHHRPVGGKAERARFQEDGQGRALRSQADHMQPSAVDLDPLTARVRRAADGGHGGSR